MNDEDKVRKTVIEACTAIAIRVGLLGFAIGTIVGAIIGAIAAGRTP